MLKIRLARTGKRNHAMFRIVVTEHTKAAHRGALEVLGSVNPHTSPSEVQLKEDRVNHWLSVGARVSNRAAHHLKEAGIDVPEKRIDGKSRSGKLPEPKEEEAPAPEATETPAAKETPKATEESAKEEAPKEDAPAEAKGEKAEEAPAKKESKEE